MSQRLRVLVCCNTTVRQEYVTGEALARLERFADWEWLPSEGTSNRPGVWGGASEILPKWNACATRLAMISTR